MDIKDAITEFYSANHGKQNPGYSALATEATLKQSVLLFDQSIVLLDRKLDFVRENPTLSGLGVVASLFVDWDEKALPGYARIMAYGHLKRYMEENASVHFIPVVKGTTRVEELLPKAEHTEAMTALLDNMPVLDESQTPWGVLAQIRGDKGAIQRCRLLRRWIFSSLAEADAAKASDEIAIRIYDYEQALKKHGAITIDGVFETIFNAQGIAGAIASAFAGSAAGLMSGSPIVGATAGAVAMIGNITLRIRKARRELDNIASAPGGEIAYLFDIKEKMIHQ